ncbi:DnaJ domain-containing protein [Patescibacteria group bacterium]|nr:DnaJ domain-containing protein [Patescibacteria group bacterium]MDE1946512.1 DnaJ domain-containing protein [Patescibacteria group bacterium]MDE2010927.1 DnaJ domain-containing protein [Patescibacteria group bacterium]MDE2233326.1 DnaJ domain-containing protein [Patescibacteria group bacterium]
MKDYYKILGVDKSASKDDVKKAFRKLAHENHPDKNKGNPEAEKRFKEASEAYSVLSDDNKRKQYDMFGSAGHGFNPNAGAAGQGFGGFDFGHGFQGFSTQGTNGQGFHFDFSNFTGGQGVEFDLGDIFGEFFGGRKHARRGKNITVDMEISFKESVFGVEKEVVVGGRKERLLVKIPPGIENGQGLRIAGKGEPSNDQNGIPGDLVVRIWVKEHPSIRKEGFHLVMNLNVRLSTALLGGTIEIETLDGNIELKIPQGTTHGEILRLKGKGVPYGNKRGDLLIVTHVNMPKKLSRQAQELIERLKGEGL